MWDKKLRQLTPIQNLASLPIYAFQFFFQNSRGFRGVFLLISLCSIVSATLRFALVFLMSHILTNINSLSTTWVFSFYIPAWFAVAFIAEVLDFFLRKYGEAISTVYGEFTSLRFYLTFLTLRSHRLINVSKERLLQLTSKYVGHLQTFLADWIWGITFKSTRLIIILTILAYQDPLVLAVNLLYMAFLLAVALRISSRFSVVARAYSEQLLETGTVLSSFLLNLNTLRRLSLRSFFEEKSTDLTAKNWAELQRLRTFHARRWFLQLNLFNLLYICTLSYGVYQVKIGALPLGFLILITWAFAELWHIIVYTIEYYVSLVQQREDSRLVRREIEGILGEDSRSSFIPPSDYEAFKNLTLREVTVRFRPSDKEQVFNLRIPDFKVNAGDKLCVIGQSGSGKTTLFNVLLNLVSFKGSYEINGKNVADLEIPAALMTVISSNDPLFKLSLHDNIVLGRSVPDEKLRTVLKGVLIDEFAPDLAAKVGDFDLNLSAGQEQRVRLARGLLTDSEFYLLDEPFNGLDRELKLKVIEFMRGYLGGKTVLLVTHNADELALVDSVFQIKNGTLLRRD